MGDDPGPLGIPSHGRYPRSGCIKPTLLNVVKAVQCPDLTGWYYGVDDQTGLLLIGDSPTVLRPCSEADYIRVSLVLMSTLGFARTLRTGTVRHALLLVSGFDPKERRRKALLIDPFNQSHRAWKIMVRKQIQSLL